MQPPVPRSEGEAGRRIVMILNLAIDEAAAPEIVRVVNCQAIRGALAGAAGVGRVQVKAADTQVFGAEERCMTARNVKSRRFIRFTCDSA